jgi:hypothetical protein
MSLQAKLFLNSDNGTGGTKIPVGIHEGTVVFSGLVTDQTWTDILFSEPTTGRAIHKRLFMPTGSKPKDGETIQDAYNREQKRNLGQITDLMLVFLGPEIVETFEATDYKEFVAKAALLLGAHKNVPVNLKVIPDYKEKMYPELPYSRYVERHNPGSETGLKLSKDDNAAISEMEMKRAAKSNAAGSASSEDLESLV